MIDQIKMILRNVNLLYIEGESDKQFSVRTLLQLLCENVYITHDLTDAMQQCNRIKPEIVVIDVGTSEFDGVAFIKTLRESNRACALLVLSNTLLELAALKGLVQQTLVKPFESAAFVSGLQACAEHLVEHEYLNFPFRKPLYFDDVFGVLYLNGEHVHLTPKEKKLIKLLYKNRHRTVTYSEIENYVWEDQSMSMGSLKSIVNKIRTKAGYSNMIRNYSNEGYKLTMDVTGETLKESE